MIDLDNLLCMCLKHQKFNLKGIYLNHKIIIKILRPKM